VYVFLVDVPGKQAKGAPRVLYWFRTPPGLKVGRDAFDDETRSAIEALHPELQFDWQQIANTPLPPAEVITWRDRRRQERAFKKAALEHDGDERESQSASDSETPELTTADGNQPTEVDGGAEVGVDRASLADAGGALGETRPNPNETAPLAMSSEASAARRRRRRRGGRGRRNPVNPVAAAPEVQGDSNVGSASASPADDETGHWSETRDGDG
jgi:hypothetical protein